MHATEDLIAALKAAREAAGLSQRALGQKVGLPQSHISKIERGGADIRLSSLVELARALGFEVALVPRRLLPAFDGLLRAGASGIQRPAYSLDDDDEDA